MPRWFKAEKTKDKTQTSSFSSREALCSYKTLRNREATHNRICKAHNYAYKTALVVDHTALVVQTTCVDAKTTLVVQAPLVEKAVDN